MSTIPFLLLLKPLSSYVVLLCVDYNPTVTVSAITDIQRVLAALIVWFTTDYQY